MRPADAPGRRLSGKVALVSGSGRGIGREIACKLAAEGARVVVNDIDDRPAGEAVEAILDAGGCAIACCGDVTADGFAETFVASALDAFGGLDIVVNNAGYTWDGVIQKTSDRQFEAMLDVHVVAPFRLLRAASVPIREFAKREADGGTRVHRKIVNVSSIVGLYGNAGQVGYASAKSALVGMTRTLAKEWGRYNVNVNCVAFGWIQTRLTQAMAAGSPSTINVGGNAIAVGMQPRLQDTFTSLIPLGRAGTAEEAAGAVYLFCLPESDYISGQVVVAAGGLLA
jgi:3-oxoacyl-[acyl-carrier protein] reductase